MGKERLRDRVGLSEDEKEGLKRNELLVFPFLSIIIGAVTFAPLIIFITDAQKSSKFIYVPIIFGGFMIFSGIRKLIVNRKEFAAYFSKKSNEEKS